MELINLASEALKFYPVSRSCSSCVPFETDRATSSFRHLQSVLTFREREFLRDSSSEREQDLPITSYVSFLRVDHKRPYVLSY